MPLITFNINDYGQVGLVHIGPTPPSNTKLVWIETDANGVLKNFKTHVKGFWDPMGNIQVLDLLTSFSTIDALSANQGRVLKGLINQLEANIQSVENLLGNYQEVSEKNQPNGYVGINEFGFADPNLLEIDGYIPQGGWDASDGTAPDPNPEVGWIWLVKTAGTTLLNGISNWEVGDHIYWSVNGWDRRPKSDITLYNALDSQDPGKALDSRQGKVLDDKATSAQNTANANALDIVDLQDAINALTIEIATIWLEMAKNSQKILRIIGTVQPGDFYDDVKLEDLDINSCEVYVGNQLLQNGMATKPFASSKVAVPPGNVGYEIRIIRIPS